MPSSIVQGLVEVVLQFFLEVVCFLVGNIVVPIISFGRWKCDDITTSVPRRKFLSAGFYHLRGQQVYLTAEATQLVGLLTVILVGVFVYCLPKT
jgi:hypothetical protein